jgi:hypothetical protein
VLVDDEKRSTSQFAKWSSAGCLLTCGAIAGAGLISGILSGPMFWKAVVVVVVGSALGIVFALSTLILRQGADQLQPSANGSQIEAVDVSGRGEVVIAAGPAGDWRLESQPVTVRQKPAGVWRGTALALVHKDEYRIVLGCFGDPADSTSWLQHAPAWVKQLRICDCGERQYLGWIRGLPKMR